MRGRTSGLSLVTGLGIAFACQRPIVHDREMERLCEDQCEHSEACEYAAPAEYVTDCPGWNPDADDEEACFERCMDFGGRDWEEDPCRFKRHAVMECTNALSCAELWGQAACSDSPISEGPCFAEQISLSECVFDGVGAE